VGRSFGSPPRFALNVNGLVRPRPAHLEFRKRFP